ncbi:4-oxalocrotonate decarboxylase [Streptomyces sulfonofaciens]|uniref:4-oxalocrotonate decarboxylase n=1 Tax=Streptomyces sulfonofaciens TaxID=68272 RepID=A0A919GCK5_9ACTN|nr:fumarylacetoacetate hydrolase family protein [Streptomyces sulfonofaciens]GHH82088.1 4-oxalocrotonate decarboxylase [Streptomyces sulfonofaciens]
MSGNVPKATTTLDVRGLAARLITAEDTRTDVLPLSRDVDLAVDDAYLVQREVLRAKEERGERIIGGKLGLTSRAKQIDMGVDNPLYGFVTSGMLHDATAPVDLSTLIHPRVEPEIVFVLKEELAGPGITPGDVLDATASVCAGLEIIDSRYQAFKFTLEDAVSDNASSALFVLGNEFVEPSGDLSLLGCLLQVNGKQVATAAGAAVCGDPAQAVAWMANAAGRRGTALKPGWLVLSGGLTAAVPLRSGDCVSADFSRLGGVSVRAR